MKSVKTIFSIIMVMIFLSACGDQRGIYYGDGTIDVKGKNTIYNTMTISPGTTVTFYPVTINFGIGLFGGYENGELIIGSGGKLLAQGTKDKIITFEAGSITFNSDASNESIMEYCEFKEGVVVSISNSMTVQYCKFNGDRWLLVYGNSNIKYNTFNTVGIGIYDNSAPLIYYNHIDLTNPAYTFAGIDIRMSVVQPDIKYNNIINVQNYAIYYESTSSSITVDSNYIANCNGKIGVDTTGEQSLNVIYINPQTSLITGAGCGW